MRSIYLAPLSLLAVPILALALTIEPGNLYKDVRSSSPEAVGINLLTREGAVQGYGNGFFGFSRQINRAEFLKIAMELYIHQRDNSFSGYDWYKNGKVTPEGCFPDVALYAWFGSSVCEAYDAGFVGGNPDGLFHPERTVNYAEALKMLTLIFGYKIPSVESGDWAEPYYRAAAAKEVDLPITIRFDTPLTRALAARLIAAFLAESKGQLQELRLAEAGEYFPSSSQSSSSSALSSQISSASSTSSVSSSVAPTPLFTLPPVSHFLILGQPSDAIASITLRSLGEVSRITSAQVKLFSEVTSVDTLELVNAKTGESVAVLRRRTTTDISDYKLTYEVQIGFDHQMTISADIDVPLVLRARIRGVDTNGSSDQLLQVRTFSVTMHGNTSNQTTNIPATSTPFPKHQTSFGRIAKVSRLSPISAKLTSGPENIISTFSISGTALPGKTIAVEHLTFTLLKTGSFEVRDWRVRQVGSTASISCSVSQDAKTLSCPNLGSIGILPSNSALKIEVLAEILVPSGSTGNSLEIDMESAGSPEQSGSIQWTDGSGHFKWIEASSPVARGTQWQ